VHVRVKPAREAFESRLQLGRQEVVLEARAVPAKRVQCRSLTG
jgi:hypothetical protein